MVDKNIKETFNIRKEIRILIIIFLCILIIGTIGFSLLKSVNLWEGFILTLETLSFLHKEEFGYVKALQVFLLFVGVVLIWFIMWTTLDLVLEGHFQKYYSGVRNMDKIKKLKDHCIVCGAGRVGEMIASILKRDGKDFVLVEKNLEVANEMQEKGYLTLYGASVDENTLINAQIKKAKKLVACTGDDAKNVLIILTAKELNPSIEIAARANDENMVRKLKKAGAKHIFLPELLGAKEAVHELGLD